MKLGFVELGFWEVMYRTSSYIVVFVGAYSSRVDRVGCSG